MKEDIANLQTQIANIEKCECKLRDDTFTDAFKPINDDIADLKTKMTGFEQSKINFAHDNAHEDIDNRLNLLEDSFSKISRKIDKFETFSESYETDFHVIQKSFDDVKSDMKSQKASIEQNTALIYVTND